MTGGCCQPAPRNAAGPGGTGWRRRSEASAASSYFLGESPPRKALGPILGLPQPMPTGPAGPWQPPPSRDLEAPKERKCLWVTQGGLGVMGHMLPKLCRSFSQGNELIGNSAKPESSFSLSQCVCVCLFLRPPPPPPASPLPLPLPLFPPPPSSLSTSFLPSLGSTQSFAQPLRSWWHPVVGGVLAATGPWGRGSREVGAGGRRSGRSGLRVATPALAAARGPALCPAVTSGSLATLPWPGPCPRPTPAWSVHLSLGAQAPLPRGTARALRLATAASCQASRVRPREG